MKKLFTLITIIAIYSNSMAQSLVDTTKLWTKGAGFNINFSQSSFSNWTAGGQNSLNLVSILNMYAIRKTKNATWDNTADFAYGVQKLQDFKLRKTDDRIELNSKYGFNLKKNLLLTSLVNFRTQFADGFAYPNGTDTPEVLLSRFMAPGYLIVSEGLDYTPYKTFSIYLSPITNKNTFVLNDALAAVGAFGVDKGKNIRAEFGWYASLKYQETVLPNVEIKSKMDLFSNYENLSVIDVNWDNAIFFKINKYFTTSFTTSLIYDKDILIASENNPLDVKDRVQFKQILAVGFNYRIGYVKK